MAEILQRVRPDIVLLNEFDYDARGIAAANFQANYLSVSQNGWLPLHYAVAGAGVFWPRTDQPGYSLIGASDHRLVWLDLEIPVADGLTLGIR